MSGAICGAACEAIPNVTIARRKTRVTALMAHPGYAPCPRVSRRKAALPVRQRRKAEMTGDCLPDVGEAPAPPEIAWRDARTEPQHRDRLAGVVGAAPGRRADSRKRNLPSGRSSADYGRRPPHALQTNRRRDKSSTRPSRVCRSKSPWQLWPAWREAKCGIPCCEAIHGHCRKVVGRERQARNPARRSINQKGRHAMRRGGQNSRRPRRARYGAPMLTPDQAPAQSAA
jgi:hypothetical protein